MKLALIVAVALVGVAVASPAVKKSSSRPKEGHNEIVLNSPVALSRRRGVVGGSDRSRLSLVRESQQGSPLVYFRTPRYYEPQYYEQSPVWVPAARGRSYRVYRKNLNKRLRDDEEDDDDESAEDDDTEDEEDEEEQDDVVVETPTWDEMFPPEEQGDYGQAQKNPSFGRRQSPQYSLAGAPPQEYEGPSGVVGPPAGRGRHALYEVPEPRQQRVRTPVAYRVISPRQYNFDVGAPKRQNYYVGNNNGGNRRQSSSSWNPFAYSQPQNDEPSSEESRRPWGPATGPVFHYQEGKSSNRYATYPYMPTSGYQGRSNSFQGRRNNKIPVFYTQRGYY